MAATKFTAIYVNHKGQIIEREIPGMNSYKIAEKFAIMLNDPEETKLMLGDYFRTRNNRKNKSFIIVTRKIF